MTLVLVITVLFLAVEKHKATYLAPIGIGLALLICHMFGVNWTGCGMNPARAFGPSVVSGNFVSVRKSHLCFRALNADVNPLTSIIAWIPLDLLAWTIDRNIDLCGFLQGTQGEYLILTIPF